MGMHSSRTSRGHGIAGLSLVLGICLIACNSDAPDGAALVATTPAVIAVAADDVAGGSTFSATISGDIDMKLQGQDVVAGTKYKRYHINMISKDPEGTQPGVVIAFGRTDTLTPGPGTYTLAAKDGFSGSVEIYSKPQRDLQITSGELVITEAKGNVLTGTFTLSAKETPEEYGDPIGLVKVEGSFVSSAVKK
jgi:hypothetical protein